MRPRCPSTLLSHSLQCTACELSCWPLMRGCCVCSCWRERECRPIRLPQLGLPVSQLQRSSSHLFNLPLLGSGHNLFGLLTAVHLHATRLHTAMSAGKCSCAAHWSPGITVVRGLRRPPTIDGDPPMSLSDAHFGNIMHFAAQSTSEGSDMCK